MKVSVLLLLLVSVVSASAQALEKESATPAEKALYFKSPSALTTEEYEQLAVILMQAQSARIGMLEHLASKTAGSDDLNQADQAATAYTAMLKTLAKKHNAADTCNWNFVSKLWQCPPVTPTQIHAEQNDPK